jgi:hypothetical protein
MTGWGIKFIVFLLIFVIGSASVRAQMYNPNQYSNPVIQKMYYNQLMTTKAIGGLIKIHMLKAGSRAGSGKSAAKTSVTRFRPTGVTILSDAEIAEIAKTPAEKKEIEDFFKQCLRLYTTTASKDRFPANDLAYALNYFLVNNYHVYKNVLENMDRYGSYGVTDLTKVPNYIYASRERAVYEQFRRALAENAAAAKLTDAEKERFTGILAIMTGVALLTYKAGLDAKNRQAIAAAQNMAERNLENLFGVSPDKLTISDKGVSF